MSKFLLNELGKKPMRLTQCSNLNIIALIENNRRSGKLVHLHDREWFAEKGIQPMEKEFTSTKGKFAGNLMKKSHANKIMDHFTDED